MVNLKEWENMLIDKLRAGIIIAERGDCVPIETVLETMRDHRQFKELSGEEKDIVLEVFRNNLGLNEYQPVYHYIMEEAPGALKANTIQVKTFSTNNEKICLCQYLYSDGSTGWSIKPKYSADEESSLVRWKDKFDDVLETAILTAEEGICIYIENILEMIGDFRRFEQLTEDEKKAALKVLNDHLGFDENQHPICTYEMKAPDPSEANMIEVYDTEFKDVFLRKYYFPNDSISWSIGPK